MPHLLIVDDDDDVRDVLSEIARESGYSVAGAASLKEAFLQFERHLPDLVLTDVRLPGASGMEIFERISGASVPVVVITGYGSLDSAVEALRCGATDYLVKPVSMERLQQILDRVASQAGDASGGWAVQEPGRMGQLVGASPLMEQLYQQLRRVAPTDVTTLLVGESGTGKELAAHAVHALSPRRRESFVAVNCGAISPNLIESELFGHERGSFTGAERQHKGYFERADKGTLFLDEVTEMPMDLQVKLLRVLETGRFMRVGTNRDISCDVRVVAATNRDPEQAVREGRLRQDLYYRLSVFPVHLPPLRERGEDVMLLAERFLDAQNAEHGTSKKFSDAAREAIRAYAWPGNVRELKNFVRRAYIMADGTDLQADTLMPQVSPGKGREEAGGRIVVPVGVTLAEADRRLILATLERCGGVKKQTAEVLGISAKTLYNRLEEYELTGYAAPDPKEGDAADGGRKEG
ncbi:sigma-54-dependent transcriptional regulator [Bordetella genomosp. 13]|uniref:Sigma-54-dependent Fis family transcriptional regulator n=1 Tax=Bordetella genomosp. 13 TaxID=463040 RepID=A0A1W6Z9R3_9BORD|nr:sigma-54 dependent transcriptional regulator [Bordetella genomosp. 13]ARP94113.1 sigma-54-dependent Fis family transcriptional regulator [Bordetella genomosp. 13]